MSFIEELYNRSPIILQNAMISAYGLLLKKQRYGKYNTQILEKLCESERYTVEQIKELQEKELSRVIEHAYKHVPYYREAWKRAGLMPSDINVDNMSVLLPLVTKENLRKNQKSFVSELTRDNEVIKITTSGTTGKPLLIYTSKAVRQANYAFMARFLGWSGIRPGEKSVTFGGRAIIPCSQKSQPYWRMNWFNKNYLFSSFHLSAQNMPSYIRALERIQPVYIDSFPSAIVVIAQYLIEHSIDIKLRVKAIVTSSETLYASQRKLIEKAFHTTVIDQYGSAEMVAFIGQCEHGNYHINPEFGIVELINENGESVEEGAVGQLVATGFLNNVMPLIRYQIGDSAVLSRETCDCGRNFPIVKKLIGREDEQIKTRDGRSISRLASIFKGCTTIKEAQIVQVDIDNIIIKIVKTDIFDKYIINDLIKELKKRVGSNVDITVRYVDSIPRTKGGKLRAVISHVD